VTVGLLQHDELFATGRGMDVQCSATDFPEIARTAPAARPTPPPIHAPSGPPTVKPSAAPPNAPLPTHAGPVNVPLEEDISTQQAAFPFSVSPTPTHTGRVLAVARSTRVRP
jgi:hypothetical protein